MDSREFAHIWLETHGLFDKDSDYEGWLGKSVMEVWEFIAKQGHSGGSTFRVFQLLNTIYEAYDNQDDPIWQAYWQSDEGKRVMAQFPIDIGSPLLPTATSKLDEFTQGMLAMPNPTAKQLEDPLFAAIWEVIKSWDVNVPEYYQGYCGANGSHVMLIFNALKQPA